MPLVPADISDEAARWFGLIGVGAAACGLWLLLFVGAVLAGSDRWRRHLLRVLPVPMVLTVAAMAGLVLGP